LSTRAAPTAQTVALLVIALRMAFDEEFDRKTTRFRISRKTLRKLADRPWLSETFRSDLIEELARLKYCAFEIEDYLAVIDFAAVLGWVRMSPNKIERPLADVHAGNKRTLGKLAVDAERDRFGPNVRHLSDEADD
jgi:hypothetical protein